MTEFRYDPKSLRADEFINDAEILDSIAYADAHKDDIELCRRILDKARAQPASFCRSWCGYNPS